MKRAFARGALIGAIALSGLALGLVAYLGGDSWLATGHVPDTEAVLIVVPLPDEDGVTVGQVVVLVSGIASNDVSLESVDPEKEVVIPGTSYTRLRDAYSFGGAAMMVSALGSEGYGHMRHVEIPPDALEKLSQATDGITVELAVPMNVFDGDTLYAFPAGTNVSDAEEISAVAAGRAYLPSADSQAVYEDLVSGIVNGLARYPGGFAKAVASGELPANLDSETAEAVERLLVALD